MSDQPDILALCRAALPEPGPEVVVELCDELDRLRAELGAVRDIIDAFDAGPVGIFSLTGEVLQARADRAAAVEAAFRAGHDAGWVHVGVSREAMRENADRTWLASDARKALVERDTSQEGRVVPLRTQDTPPADGQVVLIWDGNSWLRATYDAALCQFTNDWSAFPIVTDWWMPQPHEPPPTPAARPPL